MKPKAVKGTMDVHAVVHLSSGKVAVRDTSCYCTGCFSNDAFHTYCDGWKTHDLKQENQTTPSTNVPSSENTASESSGVTAPISSSSFTSQTSVQTPVQTYKNGLFVAAMYDDHWYVGKIEEYDPADNEYLINFMNEGSNKMGYSFKWPNRKDAIWIDEGSILCKLNEPVPGKRGIYKFPESDIKKILSMM